MEYLILCWVAVWCAVLSGIVAARKGLSPLPWVVFACLSGPLALIGLAAHPNQRLASELAGARESLTRLETLANRQREELAELLFRLLEATVGRR